MHLVSVCCVTYNHADFIKQTLEGFVTQKTNFPFEVIIADDCSTDGQQDIIKEYAKKYPDIIKPIFHSHNTGSYQNLLDAASACKGKYVAMCDGDDYWTDDMRLQKAVSFLDKNPQYTIYGTNAYKLYNDGTTEPYYNRPTIHEYTSTYEDYLKRKSVLSNTFASTYRNVYFSDGIPKEYSDLIGTQFEEMFRADSARNLIHLKRGKAYFLNESVGYSRRHGKGLASRLTEYERHITVAFAHIGFFKFFGEKYESDFEIIIKSEYQEAVKSYFQDLVSGTIPMMSELYKTYFNIVMEWLQIHQTQISNIRIPFSLEVFSEMAHKKTIIWGTGIAASRFIEQYHIPIHSDTFFVDNNTHKQGSKFMGKLIKSPEAIRSEEDALIIIASSYYKEILEQIKEQGLCSYDKIINIYDYERNMV